MSLLVFIIIGLVLFGLALYFYIEYAGKAQKESGNLKYSTLKVVFATLAWGAVLCMVGRVVYTEFNVIHTYPLAGEGRLVEIDASPSVFYGDKATYRAEVEYGGTLYYCVVEEAAAVPLYDFLGKNVECIFTVNEYESGDRRAVLDHVTAPGGSASEGR